MLVELVLLIVDVLRGFVVLVLYPVEAVVPPVIGIAAANSTFTWKTKNNAKTKTE